MTKVVTCILRKACSVISPNRSVRVGLSSVMTALKRTLFRYRMSIPSSRTTSSLTSSCTVDHIFSSVRSHGPSDLEENGRETPLFKNITKSLGKPSALHLSQYLPMHPGLQGVRRCEVSLVLDSFYDIMHVHIYCAPSASDVSSRRRA
ncbi:hypothetical protein ADUPG1_001318 [Aduncisulcus paluster]|uniref:Uncharacterized protein n=1 Tax=Aduncisulcus paluster TaxID=2918883 RepID=A0ABQ5KBN1_9EUKA|nr:hypothetical protein ADUPG1_001318 [Aduncisulcus paluster]